MDSGKKIDGDGKDNGDLAVAVTASGSEDKGEKTPGKGGFMEAAVDNIIAAGTFIVFDLLWLVDELCLGVVWFVSC